MGDYCLGNSPLTDSVAKVLTAEGIQPLDSLVLSQVSFGYIGDGSVIVMLPKLPVIWYTLALRNITVLHVLYMYTQGSMWSLEMKMYWETLDCCHCKGQEKWQRF